MNEILEVIFSLTVTFGGILMFALGLEKLEIWWKGR
tara:strand:+ start:810 stop:917 length:108 start_codon:yes stop_codon:yes gene_type:complete